MLVVVLCAPGKDALCTGQGCGTKSRRYELMDAEWDRIESLMPGRKGNAGGYGEDKRRFVNAVRWIARTGARWRHLPKRFFSRIKHDRRITTRCEQTERNDPAFVHLASSVVMPGVTVNLNWKVMRRS
jgi:transposase